MAQKDIQRLVCVYTSGTKILAYSKASGLQMGPLIQMRVEFKNVWHGRYYQEMKKDEVLVCHDRFQERDD